MNIIHQKLQADKKYCQYFNCRATHPVNDTVKSSRPKKTGVDLIEIGPAPLKRSIAEPYHTRLVPQSSKNEYHSNYYSAVEDIRKSVPYP